MLAILSREAEYSKYCRRLSPLGTGKSYRADGWPDLGCSGSLDNGQAGPLTTIGEGRESNPFLAEVVGFAAV
jgi:hypothetical protein